MRPVFSASWYRVADLAPRLRSNARIHRHRYRGETWYILQDVASERMHRFSPAGYLIIGLMDGRRTVRELWDIATTELGDEAPTQDDMIQLLAQLQGADVLQSDVPPDTAELLRRYDERQRRTAWRRWISPLSWRIPLLDPERVLRAVAPVVSPIVSLPGALLWLALVGTAVVLVALHWRELTANVLDLLLVPQNAFLLWLVFPVVKAIHEFGHACAVKAFGGEVHDMGVMMLVFTPVPYVDASAASAFGSKWQRATVGLAGMIVELAVAALAVFVWVSVEPGIVRTLAYNVILIAGVSTVLFNANPLLRYDGYYVLADLLEIPNLYSRSRGWLGYVAERYLLGRSDAEPIRATPGERAWFAVYATSSFAYRMLVMVAILIFVMQLHFYFGAMIALMIVAAGVVGPAGKTAAYLVGSPRLRQVRARALIVSSLLVACVVALLTAVPVPFRTRAEGVVWIPDEAFVRARTEGFIDRIVATPGTRVHRGDVLVVCQDPLLASRVRVLTARVREISARMEAERRQARVRAQILEDELGFAQRELAHATERLAGLVIRAGVDGALVLPHAQDLPGRFVKQGDLLGHVVDLDRLTVRTVVTQDRVDLVRHETRSVAVRLSERLMEPMPAVVLREVPGATESLPSPALGSQGGGRVPVDPRDPRGSTAMIKMFQVDLGLPSTSGVVNVGGRAYVRFDHGRASVAQQMWRELRQLFLARFSI